MSQSWAAPFTFPPHSCQKADDTIEHHGITKLAWDTKAENPVAGARGASLLSLTTTFQLILPGLKSFTAVQDLDSSCETAPLNPSFHARLSEEPDVSLCECGPWSQ